MSMAEDKFYMKNSDMISMLEKYSTFPNMVKMFKENQHPSINELTNPGVPVTNVYGAFGKVEVRLDYP